MARGQRPAFWRDVESRDAGQVADAARRLLRPANAAGWLACHVDEASARVVQAISAVPAVVAAPEPVTAACEAPLRDTEACRPEDDEFRGQHALAREAGTVHPQFFQSIKKGRARRAGTEVDVREIRGKLKLTQDAFAKAFGFAVGTVRDWEQGRAAPEAAARSLLMVIAFRPAVVKEALERYGVAVESSA